ncbi:radical SAM protein [Candidatus Pacearchaeota archaeon]|nr:radical SAM protein [Candidatus Pacearchaeota archaeon]
MKVFIKTYGCQANISDSELLAGRLLAEGNILVDNEFEADKIIINTCSVKNKTQSKIIHYMNEIENKYADKLIEVGGCLPSTINLKKRFKNIYIIDTINTNKLNGNIIRTRKDIGIVQISQGCLNYCTFCSTKLARGNLKSYRIGDIKRQFESLIKDGCKTIYLTSQDNGCYGKDIGTNLPELIKELLSVGVFEDYKIRIGMMNPWHLRKVLSGLIEVYKDKRIQPFLHIPVQSGSEKVLKDMKRIHTVSEFKEAVQIFRKEIPNIDIATDIIVGFPTETEQDFQETYNLIKEVKPEVINVASFSSRPGTKAAQKKQIPTEIVKQRTKKLNDLYLSYRPLVEERFIQKKKLSVIA